MTVDEILNEYFSAWNEAFRSKETNLIKSKMSKQFVGFWAHSNLENPMSYQYDYDLEQVLTQYDDAEKSFKCESVTERKGGLEFVVVGTETNFVNGEPHLAKAMFIWRKEGQDWKLLREYIELVN